MKFQFAKKKAVILALSAALLLAGATGGALAYLTGEADPVVNSFVPGAVTCEVVQTVTGDAETGAKVRNTGNVRAWIRAAVVGNTVNADGYLTGNADLSSYLGASGWTQHTDGYWYWSGKVEPQALTGELLTDDIDLNGTLVTVLAEAIQADGMPESVTTAIAAFEYANGGGNG